MVTRSSPDEYRQFNSRHIDSGGCHANGGSGFDTAFYGTETSKNFGVAEAKAVSYAAKNEGGLHTHSRT